MHNPLRTTAVTAAAWALFALPCAAQTALTRELVVSGLFRPVGITHAPGDFDRLYILEQHTGRVRIFKHSTGALNATSFLQIAGHSTGNEQGLLGIAFHPDYQNNGLFYVNYTMAPSPGKTMIVEYEATNPDLANAGSARTIITYSQPYSNHNAGWLAFGPDGYLYISTGDGGSGGDPGNRAQTITNQLLGKMLRIDVNGDDFPQDPNRNYSIPPDNPFVGVAGDDEIWAYGLRNPWRCSFDRKTGDLWIGDVGQGAREEISFLPATSAGGQNFGWRCYEGFATYNLAGCPPASTMTPPVHDYPRSAGFCVTGGYVYRGCAIPDLRGTYFFGDYGSSRVWSLRYDGKTVTEFQDRTAQLATSSLSSFGEDADGELYMCSLSGSIYRIVGECVADCDRSGGLDLFDFLCFTNAFNSGEPYADCDCNDALDLFDFLCFVNLFNQGCN